MIPSPAWLEHPLPTLAEAMALAPLFAEALRPEARRRRGLSGQPDAPGDIIVCASRADMPLRPADGDYLSAMDCVWPEQVDGSTWLEMIGYRWVWRSYPAGYVLRWRIAGAGGSLSTSQYQYLTESIQRRLVHAQIH